MAFLNFSSELYFFTVSRWERRRPKAIFTHSCHYMLMKSARKTYVWVLLKLLIDRPAGTITNFFCYNNCLVKNIITIGIIYRDRIKCTTPHATSMWCDYVLFIVFNSLKNCARSCPFIATTTTTSTTTLTTTTTRTGVPNSEARLQSSGPASGFRLKGGLKPD